MERKTAKVYVSLDTLLDTRLGCLVENFKDKTPEYLEDYKSRKYERFGNLSCTEFRRLYMKRSKSILANSTITGVQDLLTQIAVIQEKENASGPEPLRLILELNTYPFILTADEQAKIKRLLNQVTANSYSQVQVVCLSDKEIPPSHFKGNYTAIFMYGYSDWFLLHTSLNSFQKAIIPNISFIVPEVIFYDDKTEEEFAQKYPGKNIFDVVEVVMAPFVGVTFYPIDHFCALPIKDTTTKKSEDRPG